MKITIKVPKSLIEEARQIAKEKYEASLEDVVRNVLLVRASQISIRKLLDLNSQAFPPEELEIEFPDTISNDLKNVLQLIATPSFLDWLAEEIFWKKTTFLTGGEKK